MVEWNSPWTLGTPGAVSAFPHLPLKMSGVRTLCQASKCPLHPSPLPFCPPPPSASPTLSVSRPHDSPITCLWLYQPQTPESPFIPIHPVLLPSPFPQLLESLVLMTYLKQNLSFPQSLLRTFLPLSYSNWTQLSAEDIASFGPFQVSAASTSVSLHSLNIWQISSSE